MSRRRDEERDVTGALGTSAAFGVGLGAAHVLGGLLSEGRPRSRELGPEPIGSDPWLLREVRMAIAKEKGLDASAIIVEVHEAVVTLRITRTLPARTRRRGRSRASRVCAWCARQAEVSFQAPA